MEHGLYAAAGCNGGGVVKGSLFGRLLVDEALGSLTVDVKGLFGAPPWLPPNPLRHWGFSFLARRWRREAGAEL